MIGRHSVERWRGWSAGVVVGLFFLLCAAEVFAHTARIDRFSISPTSNVAPGTRISFSGRVYGWHCGHSYTGYTRIFRGRSARGTALYTRTFRYSNVCGSSSTNGQRYSISGSLTAASSPGTHYFTLQQCVTRTSSCTTRTVSYTVRQPNRPPSITNPGNKTVNEGQRLSFTIRATDPDAGHAASLTWSISGRPSGASFSGRGTSATFTWTPTYAQAGTYSVTFTVRDPSGLTASARITITVRDVNRRPAISSNPPTSAVEDQLYAYNPQVTDPDPGDSHTWQLLTKPSGVSFAASNGRIRWTPGDAHAGKTFRFVLRVCDKANACADQSWNVAVKNINDPPQITGTPSTTATEDQSYSFAPGVSDPDPGDSHTWKLTKAPQGATVNAQTGQVTWTPGDAHAGKTFDFTLEVCDKANVCTSRTWKVTVKNVNDPPVITSTPPTVAIEKALFAYKPTFRDPDPGDSHTWTLDQGPPGATINPNTGEVTWTPGTNDASKTFAFHIKVCDKANACAVQRWNVTVKNVNDPPKITGTPPTSATEDQPYSATFGVIDPDPNDSHTWTLKKAPQGATVNAQTGQVSWTPGDADASKTFDFELEVCDKANACATISWKVTVKNVNDPPKITGTPPFQATEDTAYSFKPGVIDPDPGDAHTWSKTKGPAGATVDPSTGAVTWTPGDADAGKTFDFAIKVCDKANVCATRSWQVKVENVNDPPSITSTPPTSATEDKAYAYKPNATDPDPGDALSWSLKKGPGSATVDKTTGTLAWTPGDADAGKTFDFELEVCDQEGACVTQTWKVTVKNVNDPPKIAGTPPTTAYVGEAMTYEPKATDPDPADTHTWSLKKGPTGATVDKATGKVSWTPGSSDAGKTFDFELEVCDNGNPKACVTQSFTVKVEQRCKVDSECAGDQICVNKVCVAPGCAKQSPRCLRGQFCQEGKCVADKCLTATCAPGTFCRPSDGKCVQPCAGLSCPTGEFCKDGTCVKDPCAANPCAADQICDTSDPQTPTCVKNPCGASSCRHGRVCSEGQCIDDPCPLIQCPSRQERCLAGQCVERQPCEVDVDCPDDEVCLSGKCYPPGCYTQTNLCTGAQLCLQAACTNDPCRSANCKKGEYCRRNDGKCVAPCANVNCATGEICVDGACQKDPCTPVQCAAGEICIAGECKKKRCTGSNVCKHGRVCDEPTNLCTDDPCAGVTCPDPRQVCRSGQCVSPPSCTFDNDCPTQQLCVNGACINPTCTSHVDCKQEEFCVNGACVPNACATVTCNQGQVCVGGQCKKTCAGVFCGADETCIDGACTQDPCAGQQCASGERCVNGNCVKDPCQQGSCKRGRVCEVDGCKPNPCGTLTCPTGQTCQDGQCQGDLPCKSDSECPGDNVCLQGKCQPPGCYTQPCSQGQVCVGGACKPDACSVTQCPDGEVCRPLDGKCVKLCRCPDGERCNASHQCEADPCANTTCSDGERCDEGKCVPDDCAKQGTDLCKHNRHCANAQCEDDPCKGLQCPSGFACRNGVCYGPPPQPEPEPEPVMDASEPTPEATVEPEPVADKTSGEQGPEASNDLMVTGGCNCHAPSSPLAPLGLLLLVWAGLLFFRRKAEVD